MKKVFLLVLVLGAVVSMPGLFESSAAPPDPDEPTRTNQTSEVRKPSEPPAPVSGTPLYTNKATQNTWNEVESAITAIEVDGTDSTVGAYMREVNSVFRIQTLASTVLPPGLFSWTRKQPSLPAGHDESVDPVLDINPYQNGVSPETVYLGGLTYNLTASNNRTFPDAIVVWKSTDGGFNWGAPTIVDSHTSSVQGLLDKPDLAVSWYSPTRGYVYVAYAVVFNLGSSDLYVARSTDGGATFGSPVKLVSGYIQAPQVVVSSNTGKVYVFWMDLSGQKFRMTSSNPNNFNVWTTQPTLNPTGTLMGPGEAIAGDGLAPCPSGVQAVTVPQARYNWVKDSIGVVWHQKEASGKTNVYYAGFSATGWTAPKVIQASSTSDQWMPALDFDETGDYLVVYFDRRNDPSNLKYREAWAKVTSTGNVLATGFVSGAFDSDPTETYGNGQVCFKGEYQDVWYWPYASGGRFHALWTGHPPSDSNDNVYISGVQ